MGYVRSFSIDTKYIYKLNKTLLNKRPVTHPLIGPNGLVFSTIEKAELHADSLANQFSLNQGPDLTEVTETVRAIKFTYITQSNLFITPGNIQLLIKKLLKK